ncbi:MAG: DUF4276 family protein [Leptospirillum sp.]
MLRLLVLVEGQTEEEFVKEVLRPHLQSFGYLNVSARILGNARLREKRGGIRGWDTVRTEILRHLSEDAGCIVTTMVDYYALPQLGTNGWPGRHPSGPMDFLMKASAVEDALLKNISAGSRSESVGYRFVPFVVMHEFEGLLFSDCNAFARGVGRMDLASKFQSIRDEFSTPEEINDSPETAPSKRVASLIPGYQKPFLGNLAALEIGLVKMRTACSHFAEWVSKLENIGKPFI